MHKIHDENEYELTYGQSHLRECIDMPHWHGQFDIGTANHISFNNTVFIKSQIVHQSDISYSDQ